MALSIPPISLPGLSSLPPMGFNSSASSALNSNGASWVGPGSGDWNVNMGGSGLSLQSATGGGSALLWIALAVGAVWLMRK